MTDAIHMRCLVCILSAFLLTISTFLDVISYAGASIENESIPILGIFSPTWNNELFAIARTYMTEKADYAIDISGRFPSRIFPEFPDQRKISGGPSLEAMYLSINSSLNSPYKPDVIVYDIEHWEFTPAQEQENPVSSISKASTLAHDAGYRFGLAPDRRYLLEYYAQINWEEVDLLVMQFQRDVPNSEDFVSNTRKVTELVRNSNPNTEILVQVSLTVAAPEEIRTALDRVVDQVDGVTIVYSSGGIAPCLNCTIENLQFVLDSLRPAKKALDLTTTSHTLEVDGQEFVIQTTTNSTIEGLELDKEGKGLIIHLPGGPSGVLKLVVPRNLIDGKFSISIDNSTLQFENNTSFLIGGDEVIHQSLLEADDRTPFWILARNETHSEIQALFGKESAVLEVTGTNVIPEFTFAPVGVLIGSSLLVALVLIRRRTFKWRF